MIITLYTTIEKLVAPESRWNSTRATNVYATLDDDGNFVVLHEVAAYGDRSSTHYLAFAEAPSAEPTAAQQAWLAHNYLSRKGSRSSVETRSPNGQVCAWAFAALGGPQGVSKAYGDGRKIYLNVAD